MFEKGTNSFTFLLVYVRPGIIIRVFSVGIVSWPEKLYRISPGCEGSLSDR